MTSQDPPEESPVERALESVNAGYVAEMRERFLQDPASVDDEWRALFEPRISGPETQAIAGSAEGAGADGGSTTGTEATISELPAGATPLAGAAARLASNMTASLAVPTATSFREMEVSVLDARRRELNEQLAPRKLTFTHLIGWALVRAANEQPAMNHHFNEADGRAFRVDPGALNLGLAVDVERPDGSRTLIVPVVRRADSLDFPAFHARCDELIERARAARLAPDDVSGATITLTNPGTLGTTASVARLMPGQGAILATGAIRQAGGRRLMTISSTYDHRIIQGAESGAFLRRIEQLLGGADRFYEEIAASLSVGLGRVPESGPDADLRAVAAGMALVSAYRSHGHLAAQLDPLGSAPPGDPSLDPASLGLSEEAMARIPSDLLRISVPGATLAEALPALQATYCGSVAYEVEHIGSHEERVWLRERIESGAHRQPFSKEAQGALLRRLSEVEGLERFLHKAYLGQKRFSIEGLDMMVPMLEQILSDARAAGARDGVIGMAHRGRLNVLANVVGVSKEALLAEFEAGRAGTDAKVPRGGLDDVKYHLGSSGSYETIAGAIEVTLSPNPSHLEAVNPVVEGRARAQQSDRSGPMVKVDPDRTLPILIHGDAAFAAQGVVAETFNLARLAGYTTGGTVHLIANNQIGFTTEPGDARSTDYSSDLAKGFDVPIVHVNGDDPEACLAAARLAMMYRERFHADVVIDLVGYRRYGHNEGDEPAYTQPITAAAIANHPSVRERYRSILVEAGAVSAEEADGWATEVAQDLAARQAAVRKGHEEPQLDRGSEAIEIEEGGEPVTAVEEATLRRLNDELHSWPEGFNVNPKLARQIERRRVALDGSEARIEWGHAESLALASLVVQGVPVRLTGQDTVRGTFSQRHAALHDAKTGNVHVPIQKLSGAAASMELHNSPLSEYACLGFEYGYAVTAPEALVIWEAQYGDFVNGAEIIIDQFLIAGLAKWRQSSRLTLLLPHGYEGQGPEHSSARLERFLALGAEGNIRVIYPTTPAQYFHLLRRQGLHGDLRPLVVMTPKSLLRLPQSASSLAELSEGVFASVLDDPRTASPEAADAVRRVILCSGKIYYDLTTAPLRDEQADLAIVRVERLYPFPDEQLEPVLARYPKAERVAWVQEEPRNMGARKFVLPKIRHLVPFRTPLGDISRPERSRPAEGYPASHLEEQARIVREALTS
ncbi:MAG: multifunctional oxoglutarate decarboxylase/oxoglutarate dehydrogenase thiamine pyrophosphate-binding subunit/dihydrolipoyllysine-residue succinyltransferase subunit [Chloroflexi bacterium]|nr:MAG: multifunctional oxoglutarate decarboxylase/oxoglutarate dehydrogenase thiamine pyrophosphate-binding subunit/dihydrolipoyllysine-residue succinyltransferase subunit [Chloroflexota bacterium]